MRTAQLEGYFLASCLCGFGTTYEANRKIIFFFFPLLKKSTCFCVQAAVEDCSERSESGLITHLMTHLRAARGASLISELRYFGGTMFGDVVEFVHTVEVQQSRAESGSLAKRSVCRLVKLRCR